MEKQALQRKIVQKILSAILTATMLLSMMTFNAVPTYAAIYGWTDISANLPVTAQGNTALLDMHFISDDEGWIVQGVTSYIYHTTDGGAIFETLNTPADATNGINAIYMLSSQEGYIAAQNGKVYRTTDGGENWSTVGSIGGTPLDIDFAQGSDAGYVCGYNGKIYRVTSTGIQSMATGVSSNLISVSMTPDSEGWACGEQVILHYVSGAWTGDQSNPTETYNSIHMVSSTEGWAGGDSGVIIHTVDGANWAYQTNPDQSNRTLNDIFFLNENEGSTVGDGGVVLHTTNGGSTWSNEADGMTTNMLNAVQFTSSTNGYVLGNKGTILKYGLSGGGAVAPTVTTTTPATNITSTSADVTGNVTFDGGSMVTLTGFVYGTDANPVIGGAGVTNVTVGSGTGAFSTTLTGLTANSTYHFRAYATNDEGTSYGTDVTFTTLGVISNSVTDTLSDRTHVEKMVGFSGKHLNAVTYGNGKFVAAGNDGSIRVSSNGSDWTASATGVCQDLKHIIYGNNEFVAVGKYGTVLQSEDAVHWTQMGFPFHGDIYSISWNGSMYCVTVEDEDHYYILTAPDLREWTKRWEIAAGSRTASKGISSGGSFYMTFGRTVKISADGILWVSYDLPESSTVNDLMVQDSTFYALLNNGKIYQSANATSWSLLSSCGITGGAQGFITDGNRFTAVGNADTGTAGTIRISDDGTTWNDGTPSSIRRMTDITVGGTTAVAVGQYGTILVSREGGSWTVVDEGANKALYAIASGDGRQVALGINGKAYVSENGVDWAVADAGSNTLNSVTWFEGKFVAVGAAGTILTSPDGILWTTQDSHTNKKLNKIIIAGDQLVAAGDWRTFLTSDDGENWTVQGTPADYDAPVYSIAYNGSDYVALISAGYVMTSNDLANWTIRPDATGEENVYDIASDGSRFVTVGDQGSIYFSEHGDTWEKAESGVENRLRSVIYSSGQWLVAGDNGILLASSDGESWELRTSGTVDRINGLFYDNGHFYAAGDYGTILKGMLLPTVQYTWTKDRDITVDTYKAAVYGNGLFVSIGVDGCVKTSSDGQSWTVRDSGTPLSLNGIIWTGTQFVCVGNNGIVITSTDGINWIKSKTPTKENNLMGIAFNGSKYVAVGTGIILSSSDAINWVKDYEPEYTLYSVAWGDNRFVAGGMGGEIYSLSGSGGSWAKYLSAVNSSRIYTVLYDGSKFIAVGNMGRIITSLNGAGFTSTTDSKAYFTSMHKFGDLYVATNYHGIIKTSSDGLDWSGANKLTGSTYMSPYLRDCAWNGSIFVVVGSERTIYNSSDASSWTKVDHERHTLDYHWLDFTGVAFNGSIYAAVGTNGRIFTSVDGVTWIRRESPVPVEFSVIVWNGSCFTAVGATVERDTARYVLTYIVTSLDGDEWVLAAQLDPRVSSVPGEGFADIDWDGTSFYGAGEGNRIYNSEDGITWTCAEISGEAGFYGVKVTNGKYFAMGYNSLFASNNGSDWTKAGNYRFKDIIYGDGVYVAASFKGELFRSADGQKWIPVFNSDNIDIPIMRERDEQFWSIAYSDGLFMVTRYSGIVEGVEDDPTPDKRIFTSPDGITWTSRSCSTIQPLYRILASENGIIAVGPYLTAISGQATFDIPEEAVSVTGVMLNETTLNMALGQIHQLTATVTPGNAVGNAVRWSVESAAPSDVVSVVNGLVTASKPGTATVRATSVFNPLCYAECAITVNGSNSATAPTVTTTTPATNITSTSADVAGNVTSDGGSAVTERGFVYSTSPDPTFEVGTAIDCGSGSGGFAQNLTGLAPNTIYHVRAYAVNSMGISYGEDISFTTTEVPSISVTGISINRLTLELIVGRSEQLTYTVLPENATNKSVTWSILNASNANVVTVTEGLISANSVGTAIIRVTSVADPNYYADCMVTVSAPSDVGGNGGGDDTDHNANDNGSDSIIIEEEIVPLGFKFTDVSGHWAEGNIYSLVEKGAVNGYPDNTFRPDKAITRAEFAIMIIKAFELPFHDGHIFDDCKEHWASEYIEAAEYYKIIKGYNEERFGPDDLITRQQMAAMISRILMLPKANDHLSFADTLSISNWAMEDVKAVVKNSIMKGYLDNTFKPKSNTTRAEAVTVITNALDRNNQ